MAYFHKMSTGFILMIYSIVIFIKDIYNILVTRVFKRRMMPFRLKCILTACLILIVSPVLPDTASAGDTLSLKSIIEEALHNNQEILALRQNINGKEAMAGAEGILDDPAIKVEMEDLSKDHPLDISPGSAMQTRYTLSQMFPYPGKLSLQKKIAFTEVRMAGTELRAKELEITKMIKESYYDYQMITESINIIEEIKDLLSNMAKIAEIRYGTGEVSQQDVIKAQVEVSMLINETLNMKADRGVAEAEIKALLNRPQDVPLPEPEEISKNMTVINPIIKINELTEKAVKNNPSLQLMRYEGEDGDLRIELAKKNYYPDFMLGIAPIQRNGRFDSWDAMFQINIPIWRDKYDYKVSEAISAADVVKSRLRAEENVKASELKAWAIKVETANRIRGLYETTLLPQAKISFDSALKNYQAGKI
ncbi:MAG: TolC family protein, partial [Nitrospira sp.]|nr:TolC family protein [Nitrospira sp.]